MDKSNGGSKAGGGGGGSGGGGIFSMFKRGSKRETGSPTLGGTTGYNVSSPFGLSHPVHVDFNSATGFTVRKKNPFFFF